MNFTFFNEDGSPKNLLKALLDLFGVVCSNSPSAIREATQVAWFQNGKLRAEINEQHADKKEEAMKLFGELGFLNNLSPTSKQYDYVVILGAALLGFRKRLKFFADLSGSLEFKSLVFLGGERKLLPDKENQETLLNPPTDGSVLPIRAGWTFDGLLPSNESEMMSLVLQQSALPLNWNSTSLIFITTPLIQTGNVTRNPNTEDTVETFKSTKPYPGRVLIVSSQPFVSFQGWQARKILKGFEVEAIGYAAPATLPVTTFLDNCAKVIYEESLFLENK